MRASCDPAKSVAGKSVGPEGGQDQGREVQEETRKGRELPNTGVICLEWEQGLDHWGKSCQGGAPTSEEHGSRRPGIPQGV